MFYETVTYGLAVRGLAIDSRSDLPRVSLRVDITEEPNVRMLQKPIEIHGHVTVSNLEVGRTYALYRYGSTEAVPSGAPFDTSADHSMNFTAQNEAFTYEDPNGFSSHSATYYLAVAL